MLPYVFAFLALVFVTVDSHAKDLERGKSLHDTHCLVCHDARIYTRPNRVANDADRLRAEVDRWRKNISLAWNPEDIDAVTWFLADHYYGIDCTKTC